MPVNGALCLRASGTTHLVHDIFGNVIAGFPGTSYMAPTALPPRFPGTSNRVSDVLLNSATERLVSYDGAGNIVTDVRSGTSYGYTYNGRNRLDTVSIAGVTQAAYTYNALEQLAVRTGVVGSPGTTHYVHDLAGNVIAETNGTGAAGTVREYVWLPEAEISPTMGSRAQVDRPLAVIDAGGGSPVVYAVHVDHLHRPIKMTDSARASVWTAVWAIPCGACDTPPASRPQAHCGDRRCRSRVRPRSISGSPATMLANIRQADVGVVPAHDARRPAPRERCRRAQPREAGLHYNWHRHYDPSLGRYTQPDPLGFSAGTSLYSYVRGAPFTFTDSEGLEIDGTWGDALPYFPNADEHYKRNRNNQCPARPPVGCKNWKQDQGGGPGGGKWRSTEGFECMYDANANLEEDTTHPDIIPWRREQNYSYNYAGGTNPWSISHIWSDVLPHYIYPSDKYSNNLTRRLPPHEPGCGCDQ